MGMEATLPSTPKNTAASAPCRGTGLETVRTEDGPVTFACTCGYCTGRKQFAARTDVRQGFTAAMTAAIPDDEEW